LKLSILIQKGKEQRKGIITLSREANAKYVIRRFHELGWSVVAAKKLMHLKKSTGNEPGRMLCGSQNRFPLARFG
jgi:hypothetical protein